VVDDGLEMEEAYRRTCRKQDIQLKQTPPVEALRSAIREYRELFRPQQLVQLRQQRRLALQAMSEFLPFQPQLFGSLLHGDGPVDTIRLLLFADAPEQVMHHLSDRHIPWQDTEVVLSYSGGRRTARPALHFFAGETMVELVMLDHQSRSDPPRDPLTGKRLEMQGIDQLNALLDEAPT
jgi:hypothetical protein